MSTYITPSKEKIENVISQSFNLKEASLTLGIGRSTLTKLIQTYEIKHKFSRRKTGQPYVPKGKAGNQYTKAKELGLPKPKYVVSNATKEKISKANKKRFSDPKERERHSRVMAKTVKENLDSYSKNNVCGRVKIINYNGVNLKGSWEVKTAQWLDSQTIEWQNEVNPQPYFWNNSWHLYFPDFYLPKRQCYIEVKGYRTDRDIAKWTQFKGMLVIIENDVINRLNEFCLYKLINECSYSGP